jgi:hypothetical protein
VVITEAVAGEGHRVGLQPPLAVRAEDVELVTAAVADVGNEDLPHAARAERAHRQRAAVPIVEVADDAHPARTRRPHRERGPRDDAARGLVMADVCAEHLPQVLVASLTDQVQIHVTERGQPAVGIVDPVGLVVIGHLEPVVGR